ncbi:MAG: hypothetical protein M3083_18110 [Actinomycetota bacterium]|nr:hypothetical protein [Actinomycetota bacterium]
MITVTLSFLILTGAANLIVDQYLRGVVRNAADQGARAGAQQGAAPDACPAKAQQVLTNLAGGPLGSNIAVTCTTTGTEVIATGTATLTGWLPVIPTWHLSVQGRSPLEQNP